MSIIVHEGDPSSEPFSDNNFYYIAWNYTPASYSRFIPINTILDTHSINVRQQYLSLLFELDQSTISNQSLINTLKIRENMSFWWLTLLSEKCNYLKSKNINIILKLYALREYISTLHDEREVHLYSNNKDLISIFNAWCLQSNYLFIHHSQPVSQNFSLNKFPSLYSLIPRSLVAISYFVLYLFNRRDFIGFNKLSTLSKKYSIFIFSYLINLHTSSYSSGVYSSHYWSTLPNQLSSEGKSVLFIHSYMKHKSLPSPRLAKNILKSFNSHSHLQDHIFIESFISPRIIFMTLLDWIRLKYLYINSRKFFSFFKRKYRFEFLLLKDDLHDSFFGIHSLQSLLYFNIFDSLFSSILSPDLILYLQENQSWERALIMQARHHISGNLVGVIHSTVRFWDLRYYSDYRNFLSSTKEAPPDCDYSAVNSTVALNSLIESGYPSHKLLESEALRYSHISESADKCFLSKSIKTLLILGDYDYVNTFNQLLFLDSLPEGLLNDFYLLFRPHPSCYINLELFPNLCLNHSSDEIYSDITNSDIIFSCCATSASVDGYSLNKPIIVYIDPLSINFSPLIGCKNVLFVSSFHDFKISLYSFLSSACSMISNDDYFFFSQDNYRWKSVIDKFT